MNLHWLPGEQMGEDTAQGAAPDVQGTTRTLSWVRHMPPASIRANSGADVGMWPATC